MAVINRKQRKVDHKSKDSSFLNGAISPTDKLGTPQTSSDLALDHHHMMSEDLSDPNAVVHTITRTKDDSGKEVKPYTVKFTLSQCADIRIDPTFKVVMFYNIACCYQRLQLYDECSEYLESSTSALKERLKTLE